MSGVTPEDAVEKKRALEIEKYLKAEKEKYEIYIKEPKLLILGSSDCGKSTLLKQLKIKYADGFVSSEITLFIVQIRKNLLSAISAMIMHYAATHGKAIFEKYFELLEFDISDEIPPRISTIAIEAAEVLKASNVLHSMDSLPETTEFFLENVERILKPDYNPTNDDILNVRVVTKQVCDTILNISGRCTHFLDVSGLKSQRTFWLSYFDDVVNLMDIYLVFYHVCDIFVELRSNYG